MRDISLSVVIPAYNEAENVDPLVGRLQSALAGWREDWEAIFVDDGSTDSTLELLRQAQQRVPQIRIARIRRNLGQTAAIAAGFRLAQGSVIVTLDADLQNDPAEIPRLVEMLKDWDCVCGVRVHRQDGRWKRISSRIGNGFRNWATGDNIVDTGCTLKAFRRGALERVELYKGMHRFLPTLLKMRGCRVTQVPVSHHPRLHGQTKYGTWGRMIKGLADVWAVRWMQKNVINFQTDLEVIEPVDTTASAETAQHRAVV